MQTWIYRIYKIHHPLGVPSLRREVTENTWSRANGAVFSFGEYPEPKIPHRLHGAIPGERGDHSYLLPLNVFLQGTVAFIFSTCTHVEKLTPHLIFPPFTGGSARRNCLCDSASQAWYSKRVVKSSSSRRSRYCLIAGVCSFRAFVASREILSFLS